MRIYSFTSNVVVYPGIAAWRFLGLPVKDAVQIRGMYSASAKGWGSLPVSVTIGKTTWDTSIFPDTKSGTYLLPLKAQIRKAEDIADTDAVSVKLKIRH